MSSSTGGSAASPSAAAPSSVVPGAPQHPVHRARGQCMLQRLCLCPWDLPPLWAVMMAAWVQSRAGQEVEASLLPSHPGEERGAARGQLQAGSPMPTHGCSAGQQLPVGLGGQAAGPQCPQLWADSASPWRDGLKEGTGCAQVSAAFPGEGSQVHCPGELLTRLTPGGFDLPPLSAPSGYAQL